MSSYLCTVAQTGMGIEMRLDLTSYSHSDSTRSIINITPTIDTNITL